MVISLDFPSIFHQSFHKMIVFRMILGHKECFRYNCNLFRIFCTVLPVRGFSTIARNSMLITGCFLLYTMHLDPSVDFICCDILLTFQNYCQKITLWDDCAILGLHGNVGDLLLDVEPRCKPPLRMPYSAILVLTSPMVPPTPSLIPC